MKIVEVLKESASTYEVIYLLNGREVKRIGGIFLHDLHKFIDNYLTNPKERKEHYVKNH